jgi:parallel beta-helix repeat protein
MKRIKGLVILIVVFLSGTPAVADFYVVAGGGRVGTQISSLPYTISDQGFYYLASNLTFKGTTGNGITVNASDVTLDLMGFCLNGPGKEAGVHRGISIPENQSNVEIRNGSLSNWETGIVSFSEGICNGVRVIAIRVRETKYDGISLSAAASGTNHLVMGCSVMLAGGNGILAGNGSLVKGNHIARNNGHGIWVLPGCTVEGNVTQSNGGNGIKSSSGCTITRNTAYSNTGMGILTDNDCTIVNNTTDGLTKGSNCTDANNTITP